MLAFFLSLSIVASAPGKVTDAFEEPLPTVLEALDPVTRESQRLQAVENLASAADVRFVPVFESLLNDPNIMLQRAAVRALGAITEPAATRVLAVVAREWPGIVSELAYTGLGDQQTEAAAAALYRIQQDTKVSETRRSRATVTLRDRYGAYSERYPPIALRKNAGLLPLLVAGAELGGIDLMAIGYAGLNPDLGAPLGLLSGAAVGLGATYLLGKDKPMSETQGYRILSYENWGLLGGFMLGIATTSDRHFHSSIQESRFVAATSALGATAGFLTGLYDDEPLPMNRQIYVDVGGVSGAAVAFGALLWRPSSDKALPAVATVQATALAGLISSRLVLPGLDIDSDDAPLLYSAPVIGGWFAPWAAYAVDPGGPGTRIPGWAFVGAGGGWFGGLALSHRLDGTADAVATGDAFGVYGSFLGIGLTKALASESRDTRSLRAVSLLSGGAAGFGLGAVTADQFSLRPASQVLIVGSTAFGAFQGAGLSTYNNQSINRRQGWGMIGGVGGGATALVITQTYEITPSVASAVLAGEGLGAWFAVIGGDRLHLEGRDLLLAALIGTDVGLAGTMLLVGPLGVDPSRIAWAGIFGLGGAGIGATAAALATPNRDHIETATLVSTALGAAAGAIIAPRFSAPSAPSVPSAITGLSILGAQPYVVRLDGTTAPGFSVTLQLN